MEEDVTKTVIKTLKAYLHEELPLDKDFFNELDSRDFLDRGKACELTDLADRGKKDCVWKLVTFIEQFYTDEMLLRLCVFLEEYSQPARPKLATIASRIRQEISNHKPQVPLPVPEDTLHRSAGVQDDEEVLFPVITPLREEFSELVSEVFFEIKKLNKERMEKLHTYLSTLLKPSGIPETVDKMKKFLGARWNELNPDLLLSIVKHLKNDKLTEMMTHYQQTLSKEGSKTLSECTAETVQLNVAPEESLVPFKIDQSPDQQTLGNVFSLRNLINRLVRRIRAMFRGFKRGSTVLFFSIPTECVWSLPSCLLPSNLSLLEEWKVLFLSVKGAFTVDIKERTIDSLDKHSLLSSLSDYKTRNDDLQTKVQQMEKIIHFKEEELTVMKREVKVLKKGKGKAVTTDQEIEENVSLEVKTVVKTEVSPYPDIKTEPSPDVDPEPSSKRFKTVQDHHIYEPPLEKISEEKLLFEKNKYKLSRLNWRKAPSLPEMMTSNWPSAVCVKSKIYVSSQWSFTPSLNVFNVITRTWAKLPFYMNGEVENTTLATTNNQVHCLGGHWRKGGKVVKYSKVVFSLDCDSLQWSDNTLPSLNIGREMATSTSFESMIVVAGGWREGSQLLSSVEVLNNSQQSSTWWKICDLPVASIHMQCTVSDTELFVGCGVGTERTVYSCNLSAVKEAMVPGDSTSPESFWHALTETPLRLSGLAVVNNCLVSVGGNDDQDVSSSGVHLYDSYKKTWTKVSDLRKSRGSPAIVFCNFEPKHEIFVFVGLNAETSVESCEVL